MIYENVIEIGSAKERFMGNYEMFSGFLYEFAERGMIKNLECALQKRNLKEAFEIAHNLKGLALNLSLTLLEQPVFEIVEQLRAGECPGKTEWDVFESAYRLTVEQIEALKKENVRLF